MKNKKTLYLVIAVIFILSIVVVVWSLWISNSRRKANVENSAVKQESRPVSDVELNEARVREIQEALKKQEELTGTITEEEKTELVKEINDSLVQEKVESDDSQVEEKKVQEILDILDGLE